MSGFLQRLASGVLDTRRAIHPAAGTIWSAAEMTGPPLAAEPIESLREVGVPPSSRRAARSQIQPERDAPVSEGAEHSEAVTFEPLVEFWQRRAVSAPQAKATAQESDSVLLPRQQASSTKQGSLQQIDRAEAVRPLVPASTPRIPAPAMAGAGKAPSFLPPSRRHAQPAQSLVEEPDSIEIHIGRIEVLTAPSRPAQSAAPRPARKSLDLREYLRRSR